MAKSFQQGSTTGLVWTVVLGLAATLGSYRFACVFPFAGFAALAAITLPAARGLGLIAAVWVVNQIVGFTMLDYSHDTQAVIWGLVIGAGALAAFGNARLAFGNETRLVSARALAAIAVSIITYQCVMFLGASALGGFENSTPTIIATIARNDMFWFAGLLVLRLALNRALPRVSGDVTYA